jgi:glycosyltransferase involved in cell wall biosynthesis
MSYIRDLPLPEEPAVSVIIPVYNTERYLAQAIESVLGQSLPAAEIIVVDDGSTDRSPEIARSYNAAVQVITQGNQGAAAARNRGIEASQGSLLAFLDADDYWTSDKLERQAAALADPGLDMVFGGVQQFISPELDEAVKQSLRLPEQISPGYCAGAMLIRREAFLKVGYFNPQRQIGDFIDWYARAQELDLKSRLLPWVVYWRRIHTYNMGLQKRSQRQDYARVLKAALDRRRGGR